MAGLGASFVLSDDVHYRAVLGVAVLRAFGLLGLWVDGLASVFWGSGFRAHGLDLALNPKLRSL